VLYWFPLYFQVTSTAAGSICEPVGMAFWLSPLTDPINNSFTVIFDYLNQRLPTSQQPLSIGNKLNSFVGYQTNYF
jgi:hypothetical protein